MRIGRIRTACVVLVVVSLSLSAAAQPPSVTVGEAVPFSATQLSDAVALRAGDAPLSVRVAREGDGIRVEVGDNAQVVAVDLADPQAAVRVVAMVVVALGTEPAPVAPQAVAPPGLHIVTPSIVVQAPAPAAIPEPSRFAMRAMVGLWRFDDTEDVMSFTGAVAYRFTASWRFAASMTSQNRITNEPGRWLLWRLGIETLHFEPFAIEAGMVQAVADDPRAPGVYADMRYYQKLGSSVRLVGGVGAHFMNGKKHESNSAFDDEVYSAYLHGGFEWRL